MKTVSYGKGGTASKGTKAVSQKAPKRKGVRISKSFKPSDKGPKVTRAAARKKFTGTEANFQKAWTAYKRTIKRRKRGSVDTSIKPLGKGKASRGWGA